MTNAGGPSVNHQSVTNMGDGDSDEELPAHNPGNDGSGAGKIQDTLMVACVCLLTIIWNCTLHRLIFATVGRWVTSDPAE